LFYRYAMIVKNLRGVVAFEPGDPIAMDRIDWLKSTDVYHTVKQKTAHIKHLIKTFKATYLPRGELKKRIKRIYLQLKKIFKKDTS